MGEDIHFRCYLKSRKTGQYFNAHEICEWNPEHSVFREFFKGRDYDVFSLFGSRRGDYAELRYSNYGMPEFLKGSAFEDYCREFGYYGFVWFSFRDFDRAVSEYSKRLSDPFAYVDSDSDEYADWVKLRDAVISGNAGIERFETKYREWLDSHRAVLDCLRDVSDRLAAYKAEFDDAYGKFADVNDTVFVFFFDN